MHTYTAHSRQYTQHKHRYYVLLIECHRAAYAKIYEKEVWT